MLWLGIGATIGANIAYGARYGLLGALISAWPAVAFIGAVEIAMQQVRRARGPRAATRVPDVPEVPSDVEQAVRAAYAASVAAGQPLSQRARGPSTIRWPGKQAPQPCRAVPAHVPARPARSQAAGGEVAAGVYDLLHGYPLMGPCTAVAEGDGAAVVARASNRHSARPPWTSRPLAQACRTVVLYCAARRSGRHRSDRLVLQSGFVTDGISLLPPGSGVRFGDRPPEVGGRVRRSSYRHR